VTRRWLLHVFGALPLVKGFQLKALVPTVIDKSITVIVDPRHYPPDGFIHKVAVEPFIFHFSDGHTEPVFKSEERYAVLEAQYRIHRAKKL
jgi:hypothetical protein